MKHFNCGEIVPGCEWTIDGESDDEILAGVADHARETHGMDEVPPDVADRVRGLISET